MAFKTVDELEFTDDYMFGEVMKNKELCIGVLERLLHIKIKDIEYPELQKALKVGYETHGIRMDVYVADSSVVYDIDMQNKVTADLGKRTRFYQSMIDADYMLKGKSYSQLKESMILFICKTDPFKKKLSRYTFETLCKEDTSINLNDKATKVIYNAGRYKEEKDQALRAFLNFVCTNEATDDFTQKLITKVAEVKRNEIFRTEYTKMNCAIADAMMEGQTKGRNEAKLEAAENLLKEGIAVETVAKCVGLSLEEVQKLAEKIKVMVNS